MAIDTILGSITFSNTYFGSQTVFAGGTAIDTQVDAGAQPSSPRRNASGTNLTGGDLYVYGLAISAVIEPGGRAGGTASRSFISGTNVISLLVSSGGLAVGLSATNGGETVSAGGTDIGASFGSGGSQIVLGGTAISATLSGGVEQGVRNLGVTSATTLMSGGYERDSRRWHRVQRHHRKRRF